METIANHIHTNALTGARDRLGKLEEAKAPQVMIDYQTKLIATLESGDGIAISGDQSLLERQFTHHEVKRGRGGKPYVRYTTPQGYVHYYPQARHGRFIAVADK